MAGRLRARVLGSGIAASLLVAASLLAAAPASAAIVDVYDAIPDTLPPNVSSLGFQAQRTSEFGQRETLVEAGGTLETVEIGFSTWACESGSWSTGCVTTPGATYQHPVTVTVYEVVGGEPGPVLATTTETVDVPFRPSANTDPLPTGCGPGATTWFSPVTSSCFNGMLFTWAFDLSDAAAVLPAEVIVGVVFDTNSYGAAPIGVTGPYDSLNVALRGEVTVGSLPDPDQAYWDSTAGGRAPGFTSATGWAANGPLMLTISTFEADAALLAPPAPPASGFAAPPVPPAPGLPATGASTGDAVLLGGAAAMLVLTGLVMLVARRNVGARH